MTQQLDEIHHIAIAVEDVATSVQWYQAHFQCEVSYQDETWALLQFGNTALALVIEAQHPPHFAITKADITPYGTPVPHRDGTHSVYIQDPDGNTVEMLKLPETTAS